MGEIGNFEIVHINRRYNIIAKIFSGLVHPNGEDVLAKSENAVEVKENKKSRLGNWNSGVLNEDEDFAHRFEINQIEKIESKRAD